MMCGGIKSAVLAAGLFLLSSGSGVEAEVRCRPSMSVLGDSYSTFQGYVEPDTNALWYFNPPHLDHTDVSSVTELWWHLLAEKMGWKVCVNNAFSGSTICNTGYNSEDYTDRSFIARMDNLGCPDVVFILGATNDSWAGSPIGDYKYGGWTAEDLKSFRPALAYLLDHMTNRYVNTDIYYVLNDGLKGEINESVREICGHYNVPLIELEGISKQDGHPNVEGMRQIASQIAEKLH